MYADYNYYVSDYCSALKEPEIPDDHIEWYLKKAEVFLNSLFLRTIPQTPYSQRISNACCEIAECFYRTEKREGISKEENDGYSVTFSSEGSSALKLAYNIAVKHLGLSGLLYRGIE